MKETNDPNWEALLSEYIEGTISEQNRRKVEEYLDLHPDLKAEIEDMRGMSLDPSGDENRSWDYLKITADEAREMLYSAAIDDALTEVERTKFEELMSRDEYREEFRSWQNNRLQPSEVTAEKDELYQLGLDLPVSEFNYESYLTARTEGILTEQENDALETFAERRKNGRKELAATDALHLTAPAGIFFPDKKELYRNEKNSRMWLYRAAAILLVFGVTASMVILLNREQGAGDVMLPLAKLPAVPADSLVRQSPSSLPDTLPSQISPLIPAMPEWRVREPDPVMYAQTQVPSAETEKQARPEIREPEIAPISAMPYELNGAVVVATGLAMRSGEDFLPTEELETAPSKSPEYLTLPELAAQKVYDQFDLTEAQREQPALAFAEMISHSAGEILDAEIEREKNYSDRGESLTYTLRVGNFEVTHTRQK